LLLEFRKLLLELALPALRLAVLLPRVPVLLQPEREQMVLCELPVPVLLRLEPEQMVLRELPVPVLLQPEPEQTVLRELCVLVPELVLLQPELG
jgi:hypothetical protein